MATQVTKRDLEESMSETHATTAAGGSDPDGVRAIIEGRRRWQRRYDASAVRDADFTTLSGVEVDPVYGPPEGAGYPGFDRIGWPGEFPFTRGLYPTGYRGRTWTIRQFAGFGNARQTNERYKMLLGHGGGGLSVAFDMPTLMGRDSDDPRALGEVGHCGVAIDSAADMDTLFDGIDLADVTTSMTISGPAVPVFCMYLAAAERQGGDLARLNGTLQTDIFKEYIAQKEWLFPPEPHLRLIGDLMEYCAAEIPAYKPLSVSGYHIREAGSTAAQELAFTLADGFGYVELGLSRGLDLDTFAPGLSFFFDSHLDFFEEIAKFRAARRIWAKWMRDVYGATTERAQWLRFHTQTAGVSLTAQQPYNNVVRTAVEALAAVLGGTNSLHTNALDETLALPTERAAEIALRTQQVLMDETGVVNVADPLGGSWYVEALTDKLEAEALDIFDRILALGGSELPAADTAALADQVAASTAAGQRGAWPMTRGILRGIEDGWFMAEIAEAAFRYQTALEKKDKLVVGVNTQQDSVTGDLEILRVSHEVETEQVQVLARRRVDRDQAAVDSALSRLVEVARTDGNLIPPMLAAARLEATLGEICDALRSEWGEYREPARF
ncbi:MAG TPA: methylmalonyl-CoA mutase family protein [Nocardioidaceae bacterium]|nr:methylmalonyl-CoA mutase family protein [Nocardioidaceae bacterium]